LFAKRSRGDGGLQQRQWGAEKKNQIDYYGNRFIGSNLKNPALRYCTCHGRRGVTVDQPGTLGDALRHAVASNRPTVLEVMVTQELGEPFRRDALKKPKRLLEKYAAYSVA